jgi:hypothetical protein
MMVMTWLFTLPALAMMVLFATVAANEMNEGIELIALRRRLQLLVAGNVRRVSRGISRGRGR